MKRKGKRKNSKSFKPNRDYLEKAMREYLSSGGTITKLEFNEENFKNFVSKPESPYAVDDFLNGV